MNVSLRIPSLLLLNALCLVAGLAVSEGATLYWGGALGATNYQSDGFTDIDNLVIAAGTFGETFQPSHDNVHEWENHWKQLDTAEYAAEFGFFSAKHDLPDNGTFAQGEKVYFWVYNTTEMAEGSEWALVTNDSWEIPAASEPIPSPSGPPSSKTLPVEWWITDSGTRQVYGGLEDERAPGGSFVEPPSGSFSLQTHTVITPIPEPNTLVLLLVAGCGVFARRRRSGH